MRNSKQNRKEKLGETNCNCGNLFIFNIPFARESFRTAFQATYSYMGAVKNENEMINDSFKGPLSTFFFFSLSFSLSLSLL